MLRKIREILFGSRITRSLNRGIDECRNKKISKFREIREDVLDWFYDKYNDLILVPCDKIRTFCFWGWKLRNTYQWGASEAYNMIAIQLEEVIKYSKEKGHCMWNSDPNTKDMRKLRTAKDLAKRLYRNELDPQYEFYSEALREKWGDLEFKTNGVEPGSVNDSNRKQYNKEWWIAHNKDSAKYKADKKYLFELLEKELDRWVD